MMFDDYTAAIICLYPDKNFSLADPNDISTLLFHNEGFVYSIEDIENKKLELSAIKQSNLYQEQRKYAYPSIADQLDVLFHGGIDVWREQIQAVKDEFPKAQ